MGADITERLIELARDAEWLCNCSDLEMGDGDTARDKVPAYVSVMAEAAAEIVRLRGEVKKLAAAVPVPRDPKAHQWNDDGERCLICGDKDWMGGPCSGPIAPAEAKGGECSRQCMDTMSCDNSCKPAAIVDSLIQLRDAKWSLSDESMPDDAQGVLNMAIEALRKKPAGGEAVAPFGWVIIGPNGSTFVPNTHAHVAESVRAMASDIVQVTTVYTTPPAAQVQQEAFIDLPQVGTAGPFIVIDGKITLPDVTMNDLIRHARTGYVEATHPAAGDKVRELVNEARETARLIDSFDERELLALDGDPHPPSSLSEAARALANACDRLEAALAQPQSGEVS